MKIKFFLLAVLFLSACYMNYSQRIIYYPDVPDVLFDKMISALEDLNYKIDQPTKYPDLTLKSLGEEFTHPHLWGKKPELSIFVIFRRAPQETAIEIRVNSIGKKRSDQELAQIRDEIVKKFEEKIK